MASPAPMPAHHLDAVERHERFLQAYAVDLNAAKAYLRAFPACANRVNAAQAGRDLLKRPHLRERLKEILAEKHTQEDLRVEHTIRALVTAAFFDAGDLYDERGFTRPVPDMPEHIRRIIESVKVEERVEIEAAEEIDAETGEVHRIAKPVRVRTIEIKVMSRAKAIELLARHQQLLNENVKLTVEDGVAEGMDEAGLAARVAGIIEAARRRRANMKEGEDLL